MSLLIRLSFISSLFLIIIIKQAFSYQCSDMSPENSYNAADVVFVGTVKKVTHINKNSSCKYELVSFVIEKIWKGGKQKEIEVYLGYRCKGFPRDNNFQKGKKYLVYAYKKPGNISDININYRYNISSCSGTKELRYYSSDVIEDIKFLGEPKYIINSNYSCDKEEEFLKQQTRENIYPCKTDEDCIIIFPNYCFFSCGIAVNKSIQKILQHDLRLLQVNSCSAAACQYDCMVVGPAVCGDNKLCTISPYLR